MNPEGEDEEYDDNNDVAENDFEEFAEGAEVEDFGDFDDGFQEPGESEVGAPPQPTSIGPPPLVSILPFPVYLFLPPVLDAFQHCIVYLSDFSQAYP